MHRRTVLRVPRLELEDAQGIPEWAGRVLWRRGSTDGSWHLAIACAQTLATGRPHASTAACDGLSDLWPKMIRPAQKGRCPMRVGQVQVMESVQASAELGLG